MSTAAKRAAFARLHESGCFVLPNPWDIGSARALETLGFKALASTSAGLAWSLGRPDNMITLEQCLSHLEALASVTRLPLNADFENGFAHDPEGVAANVTRACATGVAGLSIEDSVRDRDEPLYDFNHAVERIAAARAAIDAVGGEVILTGRSEGFISGRPDLDETIRRLRAYSAAGADCLYAPGLRDPEHIRTVCAAVAPKPVNILSMGGLSVAELAELGVRRVSLGGALARAAWGGFMTAAREIAEEGTFETLRTAPMGGDLNGIFSR
jgi:2-methylisocitrate lyase-like PEP mutase family enzyme